MSITLVWFAWSNNSHERIDFSLVVSKGKLGARVCAWAHDASLRAAPRCPGDGSSGGDGVLPTECVCRIAKRSPRDDLSP